MTRAEGLRDVIEQVDTGAVRAIRDRYGPTLGHRGGHPECRQFANLITKRERIYKVLRDDFKMDKPRFYSFFTVSVSELPRKRKHEGAEPLEPLRAFRKIVEAIPWCDADLSDERQKVDCRAMSGGFSDAKWIEKWREMNPWEIWRELGLERYKKKCPQYNYPATFNFYHNHPCTRDCRWASRNNEIL